MSKVSIPICSNSNFVSGEFELVAAKTLEKQYESFNESITWKIIGFLYSSNNFSGEIPTCIDNLFNLEVLSIFALGFAGGVILFASIIKRLIEKSRKKTFSLLVGVVLGSLKSLWPWYVVPNAGLDSSYTLAMLILISVGLVISLGVPLVARIVKKQG